MQHGLHRNHQIAREVPRPGAWVNFVAREVLMSVTALRRACPKMHPLRAFITPTGGYACNVCRKKDVKRGVKLWDMKLGFCMRLEFW